MAVLTRVACAALALSLIATGGASASGPAEDAPWYLDEFGGDAPDVSAWMDGRLGIVMPTAPRPMRFVDWRLLHGLKVGQAAGWALATPCCGTPPWASAGPSRGTYGWEQARQAVTGKSEPDFIDTDHTGPDDTFMANCFPEAFDTASATLADRIRRYGASSPAVKAWLAAQDAVFQACGMDGVALPPPLPGAPAWLTLDRAYQQAALDLYSGRNLQAAGEFAAIARDPASPWRGSGLYLAARALVREALARQTPDAYAQARAAIAALEAAPGAFGHDQAPGLLDVLAFHQTPDALLAQRTRELETADPTPALAMQFRDYTDLGEAAKTRPEALDWIDTLRARPADPPVSRSPETTAEAVARYESARRAALAHALARWRAGHDLAWLVAAIELVSPGEPEAAELVAAADGVPASSPAYVDLQHQALRLTLGRAPAASSRRRLDAILARADLSVSDRNVFTAQRAQMAASLGDFVRFVLRRRLCAGADRDVYDQPGPPRCVRQRWDDDDAQPSGVYDGVGDQGSTGLGADAVAIIDRAPLADRIALSRDRRLPARIRLDVALTSWARAVQLQDDAAIDGLSRELVPLLPLMAPEFRAIPAARPGPAKRFAEFLVLAMVPGIRVDLADYVRPEGRRIADFQQYWTDWAILKRPDPQLKPPLLVAYQAMGTNFAESYPPDWPDALTDLTCLGECGRGSEPLRTPDVLAAGARRAAAERAWLFKTGHAYDQPAPALPAGAVDAWDQMLAYIAAHPKDPRDPEALYWLVRVGHFGGSHDHSGRRAFMLLHRRYEGTIWAKKAKYYND